jgi:uncharacterized protein
MEYIMENSKPFIYLLETPYGKYFFDVNTDRIYCINENIYSSLKSILEDQDELADETSRIEIEKMEDEGLLKKDRPKVMKHPATDFMDYYLSHKIESITLQLTQNCNFRCEYCIYGQGSLLNRGHSLKKMSFVTAKKAVDFLREHSRDTERLSIGFYGGEPLLEFDLLKRIVKYAKEVFYGKSLGFTITTNASLINKEKIDFLASNSIAMLISIDGPKEIHDSKRKFAINGCGTFDIILEKLQFIKQNYPEFYEKSIHFNVVLDPSKEFDCVNHMFVGTDIFKNSLILSSIIDDVYSKEKNTYSEKFIQQQRYEEFKTILYLIGRLHYENIPNISRSRIEKDSKFSQTLGKNRITDEMSHGGPCITGARKLLIDVNGNFFPCERVSETSPVMNIGHIDKGFYINKVNQLLNISNLTEINCKDCWAICRCHICARHADNGESLCSEKIFPFCVDSKSLIESDMKRYISVKEIYARGSV